MSDDQEKIYYSIVTDCRLNPCLKETKKAWGYGSIDEAWQQFLISHNKEFKNEQNRHREWVKRHDKRGVKILKEIRRVKDEQNQI